MKHPEYHYTRLSVNGPTDNKTVLTLDEIEKVVKHGSVDTYTGMYRFTKEYYDYVKENGSVKGAQFPCYSDYFWLDIDCGDNLLLAFQDTKTYMTRMIESDLDPSYFIVYFSGNKGFHIGTKTELLPQLGVGIPSVDFPSKCREMAESIKKSMNLEYVDLSVYDSNRLWRMPGSIHSKSKKPKQECDIDLIIN